MGFDAWLTLIVVVGTVAALATERVPLPHGILVAVSILLVAGVVEVGEAFSGFSNPAPLSVAALYVLTGAVEKSGALEHLTARMLGSGNGGSDRWRLARAMVPTAAVSGFLNNTPIVAMVAPAVASWARRVGRPVSFFLMPISFAAILGGMVTIIGTSTNLVVAGLMEANGQEPLGLFEITRVGLPLAVVGLFFLIVAAPLVVPARKAPGEEVSKQAREFTVDMTVQPDGPLVGKTVADAGLRNLQGVFLIEIEREGRQIAPVRPDRVLRAKDRLIFAGNVGRVLDLQRIPGLTPAEEHHFGVTDQEHGRRFYEVVVSGGSPLAGSSLKQVGFRARYGAAVFAIHRAGERVAGKLGETPIGAGDVLLLVADGGWGRRWRDHRDFLVVSPLSGGPPLIPRKARIVGLVALGLVVSVGTGVLDILPAAMVAGLALIGFRVITRTEARDAVDLEIVVAIAAAFGLGAAMTETGLASTLAEGLVAGFEGFGDLGLLAGVLLATVALTELITNNAAAVLMFPIALAAATEAGMDPRPFAVAVAVGGSLSFLTPIGYQTNTMVYGMGGYRFSDFVRLGAFLTPVMLVLAVLLIPLGWPLRP